MKLWDISSNKNKLLYTKKSNYGSIFSIDFSPSSLKKDSTILACAGEKNKILLYHDFDKIINDENSSSDEEIKN